ncbi:hypothetical protein ILUMI_12299 [Ignelater luminosus]|uniref:Lipase domain-containing protein n=1 Tax=Ignelater luminosus TaxID=2038154 RepID=A0A8K0CUK0_IGNLU|nr:hypothetical protein ILUMI_12299 [Ignelater luminosus]
MVILRSVIVFCVFLHLNVCIPLDEDTITLGTLPEGLINEIVSFVTTGFVEEFYDCLNNSIFKEDDVKLLLYTPENPEKGILLNKANPTSFNLERPVKILIHGWLGHNNNVRIQGLKRAYLETYNCSVIAVGWSKYSHDLYSSSFCYIPRIADTIARLLCRVREGTDYKLNRIHVVGHSLGGQMAGLIGQQVQNLCEQKLGRITALDPAGPLFSYLSNDRRLDPSDAKFVDVIHTNQEYLGFYGDCGTVDFYINCGTLQPGCLYKKVISIVDIMNLPLHYVLCNHFRSMDYMIESIYSRKFIATSCEGCPGERLTGLCGEDVVSPKYTIMGEHTPLKPSFKRYFVPTNSETPFALGRY